MSEIRKQKILSLLPSYLAKPEAYTQPMLDQIFNKHMMSYIHELRRVCTEKQEPSPLEDVLLSHPSTAQWILLNESVFRILGIPPKQSWAAIQLLQDLDQAVSRYIHYSASSIHYAFNNDYDYAPVDTQN